MSRQQLSWGRLVWRRYGERERSRTIITKPYILYYEQWRATEDWMWRSTVFKTPVDWWLYIGDHDMYYPVCIYIYTVYTQTLIYYIYTYTVFFKNIHTLGTVIIHCGHLYWSKIFEWNDMSCFDAQMLMEPRLRELFQALDVGGEGSLSVKEAVLGPGKCPNKSIVFNLRYIYNHHDNENNLPLPLTTVMIGHYENREIIDQYILTSGQVDFLDDWSLDMEEDVTPAARSSSKWLSIVLVYSTIQRPFQDLNWRYLPYIRPIISDLRI